MFTDYSFLRAKLESDGVESLIAACAAYLETAEDSEKEVISLILSALRMSQRTLKDDKTALAHHLVGRLMCWRKTYPTIRALTDEIMATVPGIYPLNPDSNYPVLEQAKTEPIHVIWDDTNDWTDWVYEVAFSPDRKFILFASQNGSVQVWEVETKKRLLKLVHKNDIFSAAFSPDGHFIVTGGFDGIIAIWDIKIGTCLQTYVIQDARIYDVTFSADGQQIIVGSTTSIQFRDAKTGTILRVFNNSSTLKYGYPKLSRDGRKLAIIVYDGSATRAEILDTSTSETLLCLIEYKNIQLSDSVLFQSIAFSPDDQYIIAATDIDGTYIWDAHSGNQRLHLNKHNGDNSAIFSPDQKTVVTGGVTSSIFMWDAQTGALLHILEGHTESARSLAFSPDGRWLVSGSYDGHVMIWDIEVLKHLPSLTAHECEVEAVAFSADGLHAASMTFDTLVLWDAKTGILLDRIEAESERYAQLLQLFPDLNDGDKSQKYRGSHIRLNTGEIFEKLMPDGSIKKENYYGMIQLLNPAGNVSQRFYNGIRACSVSPDGRTIIAGDYVGRVFFLKYYDGKGTG